MNFTSRRRGFTIIELLVSVVIIAILTTVTTLSFLSAQRRARDNASKVQVQSIANAVEAYYATNKAFPGKIDVTNPIKFSDADILAYSGSTYTNCENIDTNNGPSTDTAGYKQPFLYYYFPFAIISDGCHTRANITSTASTAVLYNQLDYLPYPTWIPGLGEFLSPAPVAKNYKGGDGTATGVYAELLRASDASGNSNVARTIVYRHLKGGYAVYTRLETTIGDPDVLATPGSVGSSTTDTPLMPVYDQLIVANSYIYMVRK